MFELININKVYGDSKNSVKALKDISIKFPNKGLVAIIGTSGCGKSTLLNVMTTIDKPTSGKIYFCGKDVSKFNKKKLANYRGNEIGIVFQNFNLFEDETVYRNIIKPYLININKIPQIKNEIEKYCLYFGLNKEILNKNIYDLSGGEKQRVAIIRSLINNPKVIFADEPTGQLDESNSLNVLSIFKRISKDRLVIIVSHDLENVKKFTDKIIKMEDGKIINYPSFDISNGIKANAKYKRKSIFTWPLREGFSNLKRRKGKNVISSISIGIGLISTLLIQSFASNYKNSISSSATNQLDYGYLTVSKETNVPVGNNGLSLVKKERVEQGLLDEINNANFTYDLNFEYLISKMKFSCFGSVIENTSLTPFYSFKDELLLKGRPPNNIFFNEVVVNQKFADLFYEKYQTDCIGQEIFISANSEILFSNFYNEQIIDYFIFEESLLIVGIVDDFSFLSTSKIYYNYKTLKRNLSESFTREISLSFGYDVSWYEAIKISNNLSELSSFSHVVFADDENVKNLLKMKNDSLIFSSTPVTRENAFIELMDASSIGLNIFLIVAILGLVLIVGIISFSSYSSDKKRIGILYSLGAKRNQIVDIYCWENMLITVESLIISLAIYPLISYLLNNALTQLTGLENLISCILLKNNFLEIGVLIISCFATIILSCLCAYVPIRFGCGVKLEEELKDD